VPSRLLLAAAIALVAVACVPRARPLTGEVAPARLPRAELPDTFQKIVFRWEAIEGSIMARGEGVARLAPPDSARLDLFLAGGFGSGHAFLIGDTVRAPGGDAVRRLLPPPALLWAGVGRLAVPPAADTVARTSGDTLRADIGRDPTWRVTFVSDRLARVERIEYGRVIEWLSRAEDGNVRYQNQDAGRSLRLRITRADTVPEFDATIWH
jgi:hypothetical protein